MARKQLHIIVIEANRTFLQSKFDLRVFLVAGLHAFKDRQRCENDNSYDDSSTSFIDRDASSYRGGDGGAEATSKSTPTGQPRSQTACFLLTFFSVRLQRSLSSFSSSSFSSPSSSDDGKRRRTTVEKGGGERGEEEEG